jgi:hypothetical protein
MRPSNKTIVNRLFKTTDGVTMYLNMDVWYINGDRDKIDKLEIHSTKVRAIGNKSWSDANGGGNGLPPFARKDCPVFSTKQKAIEWVIDYLEKMLLKFKSQQAPDSPQKELSPDNIVARFKKTEDGVTMYTGLEIFVVYKHNPLTIGNYKVERVSSSGYNNGTFYFADINNAKAHQKTLIENMIK